MKRIGDPADRVVFRGPIAAGTGEHDYVCARCGAPVLERVGLRQPSSAVYECGACGGMNVIAPAPVVSDEVVERMTRWFGPVCDRYTKDRRGSPR